MASAASSPGPSSASSTSGGGVLTADALSYALFPKPFKTAGYTKPTHRRNKNVKQILSAERDRYGKPGKKAPPKGKKRTAPATATNTPNAPTPTSTSNNNNNNEDIDLDTSANATPAPATRPGSPSTLSSSMPPETIQRKEEYIAIFNIEAPPSLFPLKKYCDITGLEAPYMDPKSTLRFHNAEVYELIKTFGPGVPQSYLTLRGAGMSFF